MPSCRVLVVEDEPIVAMDIKSKLEGLGYSVLTMVSSGVAAIQAASEMRPDLILMDIHLQGDMDGIEAATCIVDRHSIPVVYLTAHGDRDTLQRAKITEPLGYVLKPFDESDLRVAVEIGLHKQQMQTHRDAIQRERTHGAVRERTEELAQRHRELTALNQAFQKHIKVRDEEEKDHQEVKSSVREQLNRIRELTFELDQRLREGPYSVPL